MNAMSRMTRKQFITLFILIILNVLLMFYDLFIYYGILDVLTFSLDSPTAQLSSDGYTYIIGWAVLEGVRSIGLSLWGTHYSKKCFTSTNQKNEKVLPITAIVLCAIRITVDIFTLCSRTK